jgi:DNA polymerase elongation subunit (family B)
MMKVLELDIETAPNLVYTWGLFKQNIGINQIVKPGYTLCWAAKWQHEPARMMRFASVQQDTEEIMLRLLWSLLDEADVVVHYNGKKFDVPTINREFVRIGLVPPSNYHQIDLYQVVKKQFNFASNKLDYVCQQLGLGNKLHHKGMELWTQCMAGDAKAWATMERYNKQDVRLLRKLYIRLQPWIMSHPNRGMYMEDPTKLVCPSCGSKKLTNKGVERPARVNAYRRYKCDSCGANPRSRLPLPGLKPALV